MNRMKISLMFLSSIIGSFTYTTESSTSRARNFLSYVYRVMRGTPSTDESLNKQPQKVGLQLVDFTNILKQNNSDFLNRIVSAVPSDASINSLRSQERGHMWNFVSSSANFNGLELNCLINPQAELMELYYLLFALSYSIDTRSVLVKMLNDAYSYELKDRTEKEYKKINGSEMMNTFIGTRAYEEMKNYEGLDKNRLEVVVKYFYNPDNDIPFTISYLERFANEAMALEKNTLDQAYSLKTKIKHAAQVNTVVATTAAITAGAIAYHQGKFDPAINAAQTMVNNTLTNVNNFLGMITGTVNGVTSGIQSAWDYVVRPF